MSDEKNITIELTPAEAHFVQVHMWHSFDMAQRLGARTAGIPGDSREQGLVAADILRKLPENPLASWSGDSEVLIKRADFWQRLKADLVAHVEQDKRASGLNEPLTESAVISAALHARMLEMEKGS